MECLNPEPSSFSGEAEITVAVYISLFTVPDRTQDTAMLLAAPIVASVMLLNCHVIIKHKY